MFIRQIINLSVRPRLLDLSAMSLPVAILAAHTNVCPTKKKPPVCKSTGGGTKNTLVKLQRASQSGKCRLGFIPDEWFLFFHNKTGSSGPYIFGLVLTNYLVSKEIFIMEHEYYLGLSILIVTIYLTKKMGPEIAAGLDKEVDSIAAGYEMSRKQEIDSFQEIIKAGKDAQMRAEGQKLLMDAKKENIAMQLEAIYRERAMIVYNTVKGRMDYHLRKHQSEVRIQQKWMIAWILENVMKSITPEFEKQAMDRALQDLVALASRAK